MFKKLFSVILVIFLIINTLEMTYATSTTNYNKEMILSKTKIKKFNNGGKYILQLNNVDKFIDSQNDIEVLNKLKIIVETKKSKIIPSILGGNKSNDLTYELLNYINLKIDSRISILEDLENQNALNELNNPNLPENEIKKVQDEIVKLQINLLDNSRTFTQKLISNLKKSLNIEESGNFKLNIEGSGSMFGNAKGELNITDYTSKTSNFDSEFKSQVDLLIDASLKGAPALKTQFSSFINFISKDGNYYLLLEKLQYSGIDNEEITSYLEKLKQLANNNDYLKIEDKENAKYISLIKKFNINSFYNESSKILLKPMLTPYKKAGEKYILLPTKEVCDAIKSIEYKINGSGEWYCSDNDYESMLKESLKNGNLYIILDGEDKHLGYDIDNSSEKGYLKIYYNDSILNKILFKIETKNPNLSNEFIEMNFINGQKLDIVSEINSQKILFSFQSNLTSDNKFNKITFIGNFGEDFNSKFNFENNKFDGDFTYALKTYKYNKATSKYGYEKTGELKGILTGVTNNNSISSLQFTIDGLNNTEKSIYDWDTNETKYLNLLSTYKVNYALKNEIIKGEIIYKENDLEKFKVTSNGKYKKEYFDLNNKINIINPLLNTDNITGNFDINLTGNINNNASKLYFDIFSKYGYMKLNIISDYKRFQNNNIEIKSPSKYKEVDDVFTDLKQTPSSSFFK